MNEQQESFRAPAVMLALVAVIACLWAIIIALAWVVVTNA